jgi:uncharacterized protein (TIGR01619 family)
MSDKWEVYFAPVDDEPAAILVDLGIAEEAPDSDRPVLLWMWLQMQSPDENGFATEDEEPMLTQIEDAFIDAVELTTGAPLVGRVTTCGRREFYFYAKSDDGFEDSITEAMEQFEGYEFETGSQPDEEWQQYFSVLYPSDEDSQQIFNRQVIDRLSENGDSLTTPRPVDHFINFESTDDRARFVAALDPIYKVIDEDFDEDPDCTLPYGVILQRISPVDWETIDDIVFELFDMAREYDGKYDGWGAQVVTD